MNLRLINLEMMTFTIQEIADSLSAQAIGKLNLPISGIAEPINAQPSQLALAMSERYFNDIPSGNAQAALISEVVNNSTLALDIDQATDHLLSSFGLKAVIIINKPRMAMAVISQMFDNRKKAPFKIHHLASIAEDAMIGEEVSVGAFTAIGNGVSIGKGSRIAANCTIEDNTVIGDNVIIHPGVVICHNVTIGNRVILHPNAIIGSDGFSFATEGDDRVEKARATLQNIPQSESFQLHRIYSLGDVTIGDDVEIGAGTAIDRGTLGSTRIGNGTKLDNKVHIGHNVVIGENCRICGQVGIAGSAVIGDRVVLGGQCGVSDHKRIGDDVIAAGASNLYRNVPAGKSVMGTPAIDLNENVKLNVIIKNLPKTMGRIKILEEKIGLKTIKKITKNS